MNNQIEVIDENIIKIENKKAIIEAILFAAGRSVSRKEIMMALEISEEEVVNIVENMILEFKKEERGIEIIKIDSEYQLATKIELYENVYQVIDKRAKPKLSNASIETLSIIAYNPKITRAEIEAIRGVSADACVYKLLEYQLIEEAGKLELPRKAYVI